MVVEGGEVGGAHLRDQSRVEICHTVLKALLWKGKKGGGVRTDSPVQGPGTAAFPAA